MFQIKGHQVSHNGITPSFPGRPLIHGHFIHGNMMVFKNQQSRISCFTDDISGVKMYVMQDAYIYLSLYFFNHKK